MALAATVEAVDLPFDDAISFFAGKAAVTTERWTDVWQEAHTRAFMVAGAAKQALVEDFRGSIRKAIGEGSTLAEFTKDFDRIVAKHGWTGWKGEGSAAGRAWRIRTIYETNLNMAYSAGRYAQMTDPDVLRVYPFWIYRHSGNPHPRLQHKAWDGLTLEATDPWWNTNWPPNGWGCGCTVEPISARGLRRQGKTGPDQAPPLEVERREIGRSGRFEMVPKGVDPGFAYNPGRAWKSEVTPPHDAILKASPDFRPAPPVPPAPKLMAPGETMTDWVRRRLTDLGKDAKIDVPSLDDPSWTTGPLSLVEPRLPRKVPAVAPPAVPPIAPAATDAEMWAASKVWAKGLTEGERSAIAAYKGDLGQVVNAALRRAHGSVPKLHAPLIDDLDMAIAASPTPRALTVYRGVKDLSWLRDKGVGDTGVLDGYTSTSIRRRVAKNFKGDGILVIDLPKGYPAAYVHHLAPTDKAQFELLIGRGARYQVVEIGDREVRLRILP